MFVTTERGNAPALTEVIPFAGTPSSERTPKGLQSQVQNSELAISVLSCDISKYLDKFFYIFIWPSLIQSRKLLL